MNSSPQSKLERLSIGVSELPQVSIVDDDESVRGALKSLLDSVGFRVEVFDSAEDFFTSARLTDTECLIVDVRMPGMSGLGVRAVLNMNNCLISIKVVAALDDGQARSRALKAGAVDF